MTEIDRLTIEQAIDCLDVGRVNLARLTLMHLLEAGDAELDGVRTVEDDSGDSRPAAFFDPIAGPEILDAPEG
jgi:hypothetical protein